MGSKDYPIYEMENQIHVWNHQLVMIIPITKTIQNPWVTSYMYELYVVCPLVN